MSTKLLEFFILLKRILLILGKVIFIFFCVWYLFQYKLYSVMFNFPLLKEIPIIGGFISRIESAGVFIVVLPMAVVIVSLLYNKSGTLNVFSLIFSVSGNIFSLYHSINLGLLEERFKVGFLTVYNHVSQEQKVSVFKYIFNEQIQNFSVEIQNKKEFETYVNTNLEKNWDYYILSLADKSVNQVKEFASKSASELHNIYLKQAKTLEIQNIIVSDNGILYSGKFWISIGVIAVVGFFLYLFYVQAKNTNDLAKEAVLQGEAQEEILRIAKIDSQVDKSINTNVSELTDCVNKLNQCIGQMDKDLKALQATVHQHSESLGQSHAGQLLLQQISNTQFDKNSINGILEICEKLANNDDRIEHITEDLKLSITHLAESFHRYNTTTATVTKSVNSITELHADAAENRIFMENLNYIRQFDPVNFKHDIGVKLEALVTNGLERHVAKLEERNDEILNKTISEMKGQIKKTEARLDQEVIKTLEKRAIMDNEITELTKATRIEIKTQKLNNDTILKKQDESMRRIETYSNEHEQIQTKLKKDAEWHEHYEDQLYTCTNQVKKNTEYMENMNDDFTANEKKLDRLNASHNEVAQHVATLENKVENLTSLVKALISLHANIKKDNAESLEVD